MTAADDPRSEMRREARELERELQAHWDALTPQQREPFEGYFAGSGLSAKAKYARSLRGLYLFHLREHGNDDGAAWVADKLEREAESERQEREREEAQQRKRQEREAALAVRRAAIDAAIARGEPVPAHLRPVGGECAMCNRPLKDPESVRLGVGPECRREMASAAAWFDEERRAGRMPAPTPL